MKIGILTFHRALNYGAILQCYALYETFRNRGHNVEVIDYRPPYIEKYRKLFYRKDFDKRSFLSKSAFLVSFPFRWYAKRNAAKAFDSFLNEKMKLSVVVYKKEQIPSYYDAIVFGSDQIWSPQICEGFDPLFWGQFFKGMTKFYAFSASVGGHNLLTVDEWKEINKKLNSFDDVSVRESRLKQDLLSYTGRDVKLTIDPTFLLDKAIFEKMSIKPSEQHYVLLFTLEKNGKAEMFAKRIANERNCDVIRVKAIPNYLIRETCYVKSAISPEEFCGYFMYADFIVTISFHGTAMSVIFNKNFYTLHSEQEDRALNLLQSVKLEDRMVNPDEVTIITNVNHSQTDSYILDMRKESLKYIAEITSDFIAKNEMP